jgi:hypothetical protein
MRAGHGTGCICIMVCKHNVGNQQVLSSRGRQVRNGFPHRVSRETGSGPCHEIASKLESRLA